MGKVYYNTKRLLKGAYETVYYYQQAFGVLNPGELKEWLKNEA